MIELRLLRKFLNAPPVRFSMLKSLSEVILLMKVLMVSPPKLLCPRIGGGMMSGSSVCSRSDVARQCWISCCLTWGTSISASCARAIL